MGGVSSVGWGLWDETEALAISGKMGKSSGVNELVSTARLPQGKEIWAGEMGLEKAN